MNGDNGDKFVTQNQFGNWREKHQKELAAWLDSVRKDLVETVRSELSDLCVSANNAQEEMEELDERLENLEAVQANCRDSVFPVVENIRKIKTTIIWGFAAIGAATVGLNIPQAWWMRILREIFQLFFTQ